MNKRKNSARKLKVSFYSISLWLLFILAAIGSVNLFENEKFIGKENIIKNNIFTIILFTLSIVSLGLTKIVNYKSKGAMNPSYKITFIKNENYEVMTFLATYIIPLACINLVVVKSFVVFIILVVVLGVIVTKMDLYMANPTLALLGYKLYSIEVNNGEQDSYIVMSKDHLTVNDNIEWIELDNNRWYVRKVK